MVRSNNQKIDLNKFTKNLKLDVELNNSGTVLEQEQNGVVRAVSKSYINMCSPNKTQKVERPTGFVKVQYSKKLRESVDTSSVQEYGRRTISRPPIGPIPQGAWCSVCKNIGPKFHKENCNEPTDDNLRITLFGFVTCVLETKTEFDDDGVISLKEKFEDSLKEKTTTKQDYLDYFDNMDTEDFETFQDNKGDWPLLNIHYKTVVKQPKNKKDKSFFSNTSIVGYNFPTSGSVSIRVYNSGLVHLVSCPWDHKDFYKSFIERLTMTDSLDNTGGFMVDTNDSLITNVFSSYSLLQDGWLDLKGLYDYFWPTNNNNQPILTKNSPKRIFTKKYKYSKKELDHDYLINLGSDDVPFYRFEIDYRDELTTPKIIIKLIPCVGSSKLPDHCKPYKITAMIFKSGKVQSIFSYCKGEESKLCDENPFVVPGDIPDQFNYIHDELSVCMNFIHNNVKTISNKVIIDADPTEIKDEVNTVSGIFPYKKKEKLKLGETVELFDKESMEWDENKGKVTDIDNKRYTIEMDNGVEYEDLGIKDIRPTKQSSMQISRTLLSGSDIPNRPTPYSFRGKCAGGDKYYIPMEGKQGRDNLYYPYCSVKNKGKYNLYIDRLLEGFPNDEQDEMDFDIQRDTDFDLYSGVLRKGVNEIGGLVKFVLDDEEYEGTLVDKYRINRGLDNTIMYKVDIGDEVVDIRGSNLIPEYREDRRWEGLGESSELRKIKLLACAKKLGLSQSPYTTQRQNNKIQNMVLDDLVELTGKDSEFIHSTSVLTPTTILNLTRRPYMGVVFPAGSQRVLLLSHEGRHYFIDEKMLIMKLEVDLQDDFTVLMDGYIKHTDVVTYYPIDCLVFNGKKLQGSYFTEESKEIYQESDITDFVESLGLDTGPYNNIIENLKHGRVFYTIMMSKIYNQSRPNIRFAKPEQYMAPFVGNVNRLGKVNIDPYNLKNRSLINDVSDLFEKPGDHDITFIPQKGSGNFLRWKRHLKTPVVLELLKKSKNGYIVGLNKKHMKHINKVPIPIPSDIITKLKGVKRKFLRFDLNFMSNGSLNPQDPVTLDVVDPIADKEQALSHDRTQLIIDAIISPIPTKVFRSGDYWELFSPKLVKLTKDSDDPGINPLIS